MPDLGLKFRRLEGHQWLILIDQGALGYMDAFHPAADTLALRLSSHLGPREMFRLNGWVRTYAEVPAEILPYTYLVT